MTVCALVVFKLFNIRNIRILSLLVGRAPPLYPSPSGLRAAMISLNAVEYLLSSSESECYI